MRTKHVSQFTTFTQTIWKERREGRKEGRKEGTTSGCFPTTFKQPARLQRPSLSLVRTTSSLYFNPPPFLPISRPSVFTCNVIDNKIDNNINHLDLR